MKSLTPAALHQHINKQFNVLAVFNMYEFRADLSALYNSLLKIKKEEFDADDRIIFEFSDTDYYFEYQFGLILASAYEIINYLEIPTFCCLILTQQDYVKQNIQYLNEKYFAYDSPIKVIEVYIDSEDIVSRIAPPLPNFNKIEKGYTFLSHHNRKHRTLFFSLLNHYQLLDNGLVSFIRSDSHGPGSKLSNSTPVHELPDDLSLVLPNPLTFCNENWYIHDLFLRDLFNSFISTTPSNFIFKNFTEDLKLHNGFRYNINFIQQSFLYVDAETTFVYPGSFITEKSFKGILCKRPFVMLGPSNNLKKLKEYGFKTFDRWWDESYDDISDPSARLLTVFDIVRNINEKPIYELIELAISMADVLEYNYNHLINNFVNSQLDNLNKQCSE